jgi:hypothetical protein
MRCRSASWRTGSTRRYRPSRCADASSRQRPGVDQHRGRGLVSRYMVGSAELWELIMVDQAGADAYNSWWQFRADSWSRLEEATGRIVTSLRRGKPIDHSMTEAVHTTCAALAPLEQFWAFPGPRGLRRRPGTSGRWSLGTARTARDSDQPRARHRVLPDGLAGRHRPGRTS